MDAAGGSPLTDSPLVEWGREGFRPTFAGLRVEEDAGTAGVEVALALRQRETIGFARGGDGEGAHPVLAAQAAVAAMRELVGGSVDIDLVWVQVGPTADDQPPFAQSLLQCRRDGREELFVGSALVRGDPAVAAVRSVLDALNRPLSRYFEEEPSPPAGSASTSPL